VPAKHHHPTTTKLVLALSLAIAAVAALAAGLAGTAGAAGGGKSSPASAVQIVRISTRKFDWGDAGIGAAAGIGISMLAVGAALLFTGDRRPQQQQQPRLAPKEQS
jgi:hypothetical protein